MKSSLWGKENSERTHKKSEKKSLHKNKVRCMSTHLPLGRKHEIVEILIHPSSWYFT